MEGPSFMSFVAAFPKNNFGWGYISNIKTENYTDVVYLYKKFITAIKISDILLKGNIMMSKLFWFFPLYAGA